MNVVNKDRRKELEKISEKLSGVLGDLESLLDEEENAISGMGGGNLEFTERYERACQARDSLTEAVSNIEEAISNIEEAVEQ